MIAIVPRFSKADIKKMLEEKKAQIERAIIGRLEFAGEKFVTLARINGNYKDRTGNLRASIGYVVLANGNQVRQGFPGGTTKGRRAARNLAKEMAKQFPKGYALIVVAGMEYAAAVESRGYDVVSSSGKIIEADLKKAISELSKKIERMK